MMAKNSSRIFSSVRGEVIGNSHSIRDSIPENSTEQYTVRSPKPRLSTAKPSTKNSRLMTAA